jgi:hypothetical protein
MTDHSSQPTPVHGQNPSPHSTMHSVPVAQLPEQPLLHMP